MLSLFSKSTKKEVIKLTPQEEQIKVECDLRVPEIKSENSILQKNASLLALSSIYNDRNNFNRNQDLNDSTNTETVQNTEKRPAFIDLNIPLESNYKECVSPIVTSHVLARAYNNALYASNEYVSHICEQSLLVQYQRLAKTCPSGVYVLPSRRTMYVWHGVIFISSSYYVQGIFRFVIEIPREYPEKLPSVRFTSKMFHPMVDECGYLDLSLFNPPIPYIVLILAYIKQTFFYSELWDRHLILDSKENTEVSTNPNSPNINSSPSESITNTDSNPSPHFSDHSLIVNSPSSLPSSSSLSPSSELDSTKLNTSEPDSTDIVTSSKISHLSDSIHDTFKTLNDKENEEFSIEKSILSCKTPKYNKINHLRLSNMEEFEKGCRNCVELSILKVYSKSDIYYNEYVSERQKKLSSGKSGIMIGSKNLDRSGGLSSGEGKDDHEEKSDILLSEVDRFANVKMTDHNDTTITFKHINMLSAEALRRVLIQQDNDYISWFTEGNQRIE